MSPTLFQTDIRRGVPEFRLTQSLSYSVSHHFSVTLREPYGIFLHVLMDDQSQGIIRILASRRHSSQIVHSVCTLTSKIGLALCTITWRLFFVLNPTLFTGDQKIPYGYKLFIRVKKSVICMIYHTRKGPSGPC